MAVLSYVLFTGLVWFCDYFDQQRISLQVLFGLAGLMLLTNSLLFLVFISGLNRRFKDPSLTFVQIFLATIYFLAGCYLLSPELRGIMFLIYYSVLIFGLFILEIRHYLILSSVVVLGYCITLFFVGQASPGSVHWHLEVMRLIAFATTLYWFSFVGGYIGRLRRRLAQSNAKLMGMLRKLEELATTDELTGLINRREMFRILERERKMADRTGVPFCVCLLDLDHFKEINDQYGHQKGDELLVLFAKIVQDELRAIDSLARYGGEEFLIILPQSRLSEAMTCARRVRSLVEGIETAALGMEQGLTVSIGVSEYLPPHDTIQALIARSDKALYLAKQRGRNRVEYILP